jgi:DNA-binding PadR family transcriptional regulator
VAKDERLERKGYEVSEAGRKKRLERLVKKANRHLLVDPEKKTPHDRMMWEEGTNRLIAALRHHRDSGDSRIKD